MSVPILSLHNVLVRFHYLPILSSVFLTSKGFSYAESLRGAFFHAISYTVPSHANLVASHSKKLAQPCTCKSASGSLLSLFLQGIWIKIEFYHREATRSCSCMMHPGTESVGGTMKTLRGKSFLNIFRRENSRQCCPTQIRLSRPAASDIRQNFCFLTKTALESILESKFLFKERLQALILVKLMEGMWHWTQYIGSFTHKSCSAGEHCTVFILTMEHCFFKTFCELMQKKLPKGNKTETQVTAYHAQQENQEVSHFPKPTWTRRKKKSGKNYHIWSNNWLFLKSKLHFNNQFNSCNKLDFMRIYPVLIRIEI